MFDYLKVNKKFLPNITELQSRNYEIGTLQTKCFGNLLEEYQLDEFGNLYYVEVDYDYVETKNDESRKFQFPYTLVEKSRKSKVFPYTGMVEAYDFISDPEMEKDSVWISLTFKFVDGIIQGLPTLEEVKVDNIYNIRERKREMDIRLEKQKRDPIFKVCRFLWLFISKIITKLCKIQSFLIKYEAR